MIGDTVQINPKVAETNCGRMLSLDARESHYAIATDKRYKGCIGTVKNEYIYPGRNVWAVDVELLDGTTVLVMNVELDKIREGSTL